MFRIQPYLESEKYVKFHLTTPILLPANGDTQEKEGYTFKLKDRDNFYDWYNAYFRVDFKFDATANGGNVDADTESAPINGSFSLIKSLRVGSSGKELYYANNIHFSFSSKICLNFLMIFQEAWQKISFGILTLTQPHRLMQMRRILECEKERFYHMVERWFRQQFL